MHALRFYSKLVRLKLFGLDQNDVPISGFYSKLVRLKLTRTSERKFTKTVRFLFQTGAIKTLHNRILSQPSPQFLFQTGAIKTFSSIHPVCLLQSFLFQTGAIKT